MQEERQDIVLPKPEIEPARNSLVATFISIALYVGAYLLFFRQRLDWIVLLLVVIIIHEMGHFVAMKRFGYTGVKMLFVPFLGAYVSGEPQRADPRHRVITLLAGPLPGMIIGIGLYVIYVNTGDPVYLRGSYLFILLNAFNLLPVSPLDGGQLLETLFFETNRKVQTLFIILSCILLFYLSLYTRNYFLLLVVWLLIMRFRLLDRIGRLRREMASRGIDYHRSFGELSDAEYTAIRGVLIDKMSSLREVDREKIDEDEDMVVHHMRNVLAPASSTELSITSKLMICLVWLIFLLIPLVLLLQTRLF